MLFPWLQSTYGHFLDESSSLHNKLKAHARNFNMCAKITRKILCRSTIYSEPSADHISDRLGFKLRYVSAQTYSTWPPLRIRRAKVAAIQVSEFMRDGGILFLTGMFGIN
jgi:hypothetical protein